jgi:hypothetical protein
MREFTVEDANNLYDLLTSRELLLSEQANDVVGALSGLYARTSELFDVELPRVIEAAATSPDVQKDVLEGVKSLCERIHQHLYDGGLIPRERGHWDD